MYYYNNRLLTLYYIMYLGIKCIYVYTNDIFEGKIKNIIKLFIRIYDINKNYTK